jgi:hypothetical protein|tara:strand:- start:5049 stop:5258 length:210 start_codon:yes stop_codon:yes gene_type:complete
MMFGFEITTSIDVIRPLIPPGPMFRGAASLSQDVEKSWAFKSNVKDKNRKEKVVFIDDYFNVFYLLSKV